jgi:hypothetical protein
MRYDSRLAEDWRVVELLSEGGRVAASWLMELRAEVDGSGMESTCTHWQQRKAASGRGKKQICWVLL